MKHRLSLRQGSTGGNVGEGCGGNGYNGSFVPRPPVTTSNSRIVNFLTALCDSLLVCSFAILVSFPDRTARLLSSKASPIDRERPDVRRVFLKRAPRLASIYKVGRRFPPTRVTTDTEEHTRCRAYSYSSTRAQSNLRGGHRRQFRVPRRSMAASHPRQSYPWEMSDRSFCPLL